MKLSHSFFIFSFLILSSLTSHAQLLDQSVDWVLGDHIDGSVSGSGSDLTVAGNGAFGVRIEEGFGVAGDEGFFVYTERAGSFSLQARLFPLFGQSAIMVRENAADAASNFYSVELEFDFGAGVIGASSLFRFRSGAGGNVENPLVDADNNRIEDTGDGLWFRVTRIEPVDVFFGEFSPDGQNWFIADSRILKWAGESAAYGIAVGSGGDDAELGEVEVSNLEFVSPPPVAQRTISQQSFNSGETLQVDVSVFVSGSDRSTATLRETVPTGWTVSGITMGGTASGGIISWNLSGLPVGETVVSYNVAVPASPSDFANWSGNVLESVNILGPNTLPFLDITGGDRVEDALLAFYTFHEGSGLIVNDLSGAGEPMDLFIENPNNMEWGEGFLETTGVNQIKTAGPATKIIAGSKSTDELTVEGWIKTSDIGQNGPARIITCSLDATQRNFTLGQGRFNAGSDRFEMRYRTTDNNEFQANTLRGTFSEALTHVVWTRAANGDVAAYINNEQQTVVQSGGADPITQVTGSFSPWDDSFFFGVGNEISAQRAWLGQFHLVAIYNKALSVSEVNQNYNAGPFVGGQSEVLDWEIF